MAGARAKSQAIGSSEWIQNEREQSAQFMDQEVEEFSYSVRNELEWLNEHMAEIFSKNQVNFADIFKTPGKLRGKTPRTARKQLTLGARQPLTDIFAPNVPAPQSAQKTAFFDKVAQFEIPDDGENQPPSQRPTSRGKSPQRIGKPGNTDSGYHGMTEDEMEIDSKTETETATTSSQQSVAQKVPLRENQPPPQRIREGTADATNSSDDSFMSAREDPTSRNVSKEQLRENQDGDNATVPGDGIDVDQAMNDDQAAMPATQESETEPMDQDRELDAETSRSLSDASASSPEKPLQRKSSFTFTALPLRDPFTAKRSIGNRNSQIDAQTGRGSVLGRSLGAKGMGVAQDDDAEYAQEKPEESKAHNKSSTRLLHERINLLGKKKSIPQNALGAQAVYPQLPGAEAGSKETVRTVAPVEDEDDDWIAPTKPVQKAQKATAEPSWDSPSRPAMHQKSISTTQIPSPARLEMETKTTQQKAFSVSNPSFAHAVGELQSTTPAGSPSTKKSQDGPLSASKSKLYSVLKSAKSIFASSASTSAAAKLEAHNSSPAKSPTRNVSDESKTAVVFNMPGALYSEPQPPQSPTRPMSIISASPSRKTRSSNESQKKREKELKAQQKAADELERAREKERQKAAKEQEQRLKADQAEAAKREKEQKKQAAAEAEQRPTSAGNEQARDVEVRPTSSKSMLPSGKLRAPGRLLKPVREPQQAVRPAPVPIRMPSQMQRPQQVPSSSTSSKPHHESNTAPPAARPPTATRPGSAQGGSIAPNNARLKALEAAARKKEADEKAAQKKAEQKREMDRKRAAKAEEERRAEEERKAAEQQRVQEAKLAAQRKAEQQAAEAKRREQQRVEQQRQQEEAQKAKAAHELAEAIKRERVQQQPAHPRGDVGGTLRQLAKNVAPEQASALATVRPIPLPNPAKPPKRVFDPDEDKQSVHHQQAPQRPGMQRGPNSYQQKDAKRRRTNDEEQQPAPGERHSVMAPPKRPSNMRKESGLSKFPHAYAHAPLPANHHAASMLKQALTAQQNLHYPPNKPGMPPNHPSQMVQVSNARIPFAENANPPAQQHYSQQGQQMHPGFENMQPGAASQNNKFKTPGRPAHAPKSAKSSPLYPNGENIQLPEIATDSEDEDSDDEDDNTGFRAPSWVASPALRDLLTQQQLVDPETVFGPIGELKMDEMFRNGKNADRLKRLRDRGSSAAWVQSGDAVTSAEKRRDMEMRERVVREGGWRYEPDA